MATQINVATVQKIAASAIALNRRISRVDSNLGKKIEQQHSLRSLLNI
ncbi:hypothetical protein [Nostoc sp.]